MLLRRFASICSKPRQRRQVLLIRRSASQSPASRGLNLEELERQAKSSVGAEPFFGIAPRKVRDDDDEDFTPSTVLAAAAGPPAPSAASRSARQNYFSQTWAAQKRIILGDSALGEELSEFPQFIVSSPEPPLERIWQVTPNVHESLHETFKFVSLKVLSTEIATKHKLDLYCHLPSYMIEWDRRRKELLKDLQQLSADIICLQEVDKFDDVSSDLSLEGYDGLYQGITGKSKSGCAIFWRRNRFKLLHEEKMDFFAQDMRFKVAQLCIFQLIVPGITNDGASSNAGVPNQKLGNCLLVGNMEALFNPRRGDIKLAQCRLFFQQVHKLSTEWPGVPVVIGGCFHATPQSYIYKFISESQLDLCGLDYRNLSGHFMDEISDGESPMRDQRRKNECQGSDDSSLRNTPKDDKPTMTNHEDPKGTEVQSRALLSEAIRILSDICKSEEPSKVVDENVCSVEKSAGNDNASENKKHFGDNAAEEHPVVLHPVNETSTISNATGPSRTGSTVDYGWDPKILKEICGSENITIVRHDLRLFSVYPEVQGQVTTRDTKGEPCITMTHNDFKGTVDYIWRSEGLKTLKVLDTFPMDKFVKSPILPFLASGSDHVSLACELTFCPRQE